MSSSESTTPAPDDTLQDRRLEPLGGSGAGRAVPVVTRLAERALEVPDLPQAYQDDRLILLVRDPRTLFVYWDFHPETVRRAEAAVAGGRALLRVLMLGGSEPRVVREVPIDLAARSLYLYELEPNHDYRVELLLKSSDGSDFLIVRPSNVVTLPANRPSAWIEDRFASIPLEISLPEAAMFLSGRTISDVAARLHGRAYELSLGQQPTGDLASSAQGIREGFGGRSWSGTLARPPPSSPSGDER